MKTASLFGFVSALATAILTLVLYFLGLHSDLTKLPTAQWIGSIGNLAILITCLVMAVKTRRAEIPAAEGFGYGSALWMSFRTSVVAAILGALFGLAYGSYINPSFNEMLMQDRLNKLENSGMSGDKLEQAEAMTRHFFTPIPLMIYLVVVGIVVGFVISLIVAAVMKRPAVVPPRM